MRLQWLELRDFRCYDHLRWEPDPGLNVLVGDNGAGKTSVLEGVGYLGSLRSFRRVADVALVRASADAAVVRGEFGDETGTTLVEVELPAAGRRRVQVNGKRPTRLRDVIAKVPIVTFDPDDLELVKGPAGERRRYLDDLAARLWPAAGAEQDEYDRVVRQRNALLRSERDGVPDAELDVWDRQAAAAGARLTIRRLGLADELRPLLAAVYGEVAGPEAAGLAPTYESKSWQTRPADAGAAEEVLLQRLAERRWLDRERRVTTVGPHRDEPGFELGGRDLRAMASQGEQRTAALALRLAAFDLVRQRAGTAPMLILDDVFSELDGARAAAVVARLPAGQVFASTARLDDVPAAGRRWDVGGGALS